MTQSRQVPQGRAVFRKKSAIPKGKPRLSNVEITEKSKEECPDCGRRLFKALRTPKRDWAYVGHDAFTFCVNNECDWNVPDVMLKKLWNSYFKDPILKCGDCGLQTLTIDSVNDTHVKFRCQRRFIQAVRVSEGGATGRTTIVGVKGDFNDNGGVRVCPGRYQRALTALNDEQTVAVHAVLALEDGPKPEIPESIVKTELPISINELTSQQTAEHNDGQQSNDAPGGLKSDDSGEDRQSDGAENAGQKVVPVGFRPDGSRFKHYEARAEVLEALDLICASGQRLWWALTDQTGSGDADYVTYTEAELGWSQVASIVSETGMTPSAVRAVLQRTIKSGNVFRTHEKLEGLDGYKMYGYKVSNKGRDWLRRWGLGRQKGESDAR